MDLVDKHSLDGCLVLNLQCGVPDIGYSISVVKTHSLDFQEFHTWDKFCGVDAGFNFFVSGTVDHPAPCAGIRAGICINRLGGEFLYHDRSHKEHIGTGAFVNDNYFEFQLELPNRAVRDMLMKIMVLDRISDREKNKFGIRIDIINLTSELSEGTPVSFQIARIYI